VLDSSVRYLDSSVRYLDRPCKRGILSQKNNFGKQSYQTGGCVGFTGAGSSVGENRNASDYEGRSPRTTIPSHYRSGRGTLQDILPEFKKLHNAYPLPEEDSTAPVITPVANTPDCILDTPRKHDGPALQNTRIPQNPRKIRKKKKKQISPPSPPQTLEHEKTDLTQQLSTNFIRDATASEKTN
jgi:hypothetical protein